MSWKIHLLFLTLSCCIFTTPSAVAQLTPDNTLGAESSLVNPNATLNGLPTQLIEGGAARGSSLFHSFSDFNVGNLQRVYFSNPTGIANILTRVTGNTPSNILGTLGVNGSANLFLINPNGIIFGENAQLDISGSFLATTADSLILDNYEFSATNPTSPPLLTLNVTPGLQYGANQPQRTISSTGNLTVGENLTLSAGNLNLQGRLQAGGDLQLQALNAIRIRDDIANPFIAAAGGKLILQGNETIDIFALNHPDSGLFSGGDMVLKSANTVGGDAHYWTGGNFRIEQLDGSLGDLFSPFDPVIRASGDITFANYIGASLHIFAGGSVRITGDVTITGTDTTNFINETVTLSNGNQININGSTKPTLDIRAGTLAVGTPLGCIGCPPSTVTFGATPTSADINIGNIRMDEPDGQVFLSNQYRPNLALPGGKIQVGQINTSSINNGNAGNGGDVVIDSISSIFTENIDSNSNAFGGESNSGGSITLIAQGNMTTGDIDTSSQSFRRTAESGGAISIASGGDIATGRLNSVSFSEFDNARYGGAITLNAEGRIFTQDINSSTISVTGFPVSNNPQVIGAGGNLILSAKGDIITGNIDSRSLSYFRNSVNGGDVHLLSGGSISTGQIDSSSNVTRGDDAGAGGKIDLYANEDITTGNLLSYSLSLLGNANTGGAVTLNTNRNISVGVGSPVPVIETYGASGGNLHLMSQYGSIILDNALINSNANSGNGGDIHIVASLVDLIATDLATTATQSSNAGSIFVQSKDRISLDRSRLFTSLESGATGIGGDIEIIANQIDLKNHSFIDTATFGLGDAGNVVVSADRLSLDRSSIFSIAGEQGNAGDVTIQVSDRVSLSNESNISTAVSQTATQGNGGDLFIQAGSLSLTDGSQLQALTKGIGDAGDIFLNVRDSIDISGIGNNGFLSGIFSSSDTASSGRGGNLTVTTLGSLNIHDGAVLSTQTFSQLDGGNIAVNAENLNLNNGGQLLTSTFNSGNAGNITVNAKNGINLSNVDPNFDNRVSPSMLRENTARMTNPTILSERESNNLLTEAQVLDNFFSLDPLNNINPNVEFSTRIPYVSIFGTGDGTNDYYSFDVKAGGTRAIIDIDSAVGGSPKLSLFDRQGNLLSSNIFAAPSLGAGGSISIFDPYLRYVFSAPGTYIIKVENQGNPNAGLPVGMSYRLQVSLETPNILGSRVNGGSASGLFASTQGTGNAGNITLNAPQLSLLNGAEVSASTFGSGQGGLLVVNASNSVEVNNGAGLFFDSRGTGNAQGIRINTGDLRVENGGQITVSGSGTGISGDLEITANSIFLNNQGRLRATTAASQGGNIRLTVAKDIVLRHNSEISAEAFGAANGGNITLNVGRFIWAILSENSDIVAGAVDGNGGRIEGSARSIFGFRQFRGQRTPESDFTASSEFGIDGIIDINLRNNPNVDPLPSDFLSSGLAEGCLADNGEPLANLIYTGRGGMPESPYDPLTSNDIWEDVQPPKSWSESASEPLGEVQGWVVNEKGNVVLVAEISSNRVGCGRALREPVQ